MRYIASYKTQTQISVISRSDFNPYTANHDYNRFNPFLAV